MKMMQREPTRPGIFLEEDYLKPLGLSYDKAAKLLGISQHSRTLLFIFN